MYTWHRVFGSIEPAPAPAEICEELLRHGLTVRPSFRGDEDGWFAARLELEGSSSSLQIERYLVRTDRLRPDLNSWSAWVENLPANSEREVVLDALISTVQLITMYEEAAEGEAASPACSVLSRWLAERVQGFYQADGMGFYDRSGALLVAEAADRAHA
jgi:hypothetical protein